MGFEAASASFKRKNKLAHPSIGTTELFDSNWFTVSPLLSSDLWILKARKIQLTFIKGTSTCIKKSLVCRTCVWGKNAGIGWSESVKISLDARNKSWNLCCIPSLACRIQNLMLISFSGNLFANVCCFSSQIYQLRLRHDPNSITTKTATSWQKPSFMQEKHQICVMHNFTNSSRFEEKQRRSEMEFTEHCLIFYEIEIASWFQVTINKLWFKAASMKLCGIWSL